MEEAAAKLLTQSAANEKQLHEHTDSLSSLLTDRVLECMNVSAKPVKFILTFLTLLVMLHLQFKCLGTILRSSKHALEYLPKDLLLQVLLYP